MNRKSTSPYAKTNQKDTSYDVSSTVTAFRDSVTGTSAPSMKRNVTSYNDNQVTSTPPKLQKTQSVKDPMEVLLSSPAVVGTLSSSPAGKEKQGQTIVTIVRKLNNDAMLIAVEGQSAYTWQNYFNRSFNEHQHRMADPFGEGIQAIPIRGQLLKALALGDSVLDAMFKDKERPTTKKDLIDYLKQNAEYIVSSIGKEDGNTKVWVFTLLQFIELVGVQRANEFEEKICNVIMDFFDKVYRPAKKDVDCNSIVHFPEDITRTDAMRIHNDGTPYVVTTKNFFLDTDDKVDAMTAIAIGAFGRGTSYA